MFNIRVYGILINDQQQVLVSDELVREMRITKFCGGGLEKGEGTIDCLKREFMEEMNLRVEITGHLYTTDFFQQSAFNKEHQIISIYYTVKGLEEIKVPVRSVRFDFDQQQLLQHRNTGETETFRFIDWNIFNEDTVSLSIDKVVARIIKEKLNTSPAFRFITLENERARLEPLEQKHYENLLPVAMHKEMWQYMIDTVLNEDDFKIYFSRALSEKENGLSHAFAVFDKATQTYAGSTRYGSFSVPHKRLEIGWTWYSPVHQGTGLNKACKHLLLQYGFEKLRLNRIELKTGSLNLRSQRAMEKLGAVKEGVFRKYVLNTDGTIRDSVYYSFINDDWRTTEEKYFL